MSIPCSGEITGNLTGNFLFPASGGRKYAQSLLEKIKNFKALHENTTLFCEEQGIFFRGTPCSAEDRANKPSELSDYSVGATWGVKGPRFYLLNVLRRKLSYPELRRAVVEQDRLFRPPNDRDRGPGIGDATHPGPDRRRPFACRALFPGRRQDHAFPAQSAVIENGFVFLPEEAPWLADYVSELTTFPAGRHDDQELDRMRRWPGRGRSARGWARRTGASFIGGVGRAGGSLLPPGEDGRAIARRKTGVLTNALWRGRMRAGSGPYQGKPARARMVASTPSRFCNTSWFQKRSTLQPWCAR